jgi:hypothetical protein
MTMNLSGCFRNGPRVAVAVALAALAIALCAAPVRAERSTEMAAQIARLRSEVEDLSSRIETEKDAMTGQLRSYTAQKADLEMEVQRAEMTLDQLRDAARRRAEALDRDTRRDALLRPVLSAAIGAIRERIAAGLPFQVAERTADLDALSRQLDEGLIRVPDGVARLWDRVEDEFRLSRENGLYKQVIELDGNELLADVARVGMVMLYFQAGDGRVGSAVHRDGRWSWQALAAKQARVQIATLFDSFKKQIRAGFFLLPAALPPGGDR